MTRDAECCCWEASVNLS